MTKLPIKTSLMWIWGSTIVISGGVILALTVKQKWDSKFLKNPKFTIQTIVQKCSSVETLSTDYLAECLGLSLDKSYTLFEYSNSHLKKVLESSPLIKSANVSKILPSTLQIEYTLRQPIAIFQDLQNTVIDEDKVLFPLQPFRTPKLLPEITLGDPTDSKLSLALAVLAEIKKYPIDRPIKSIHRIDVSRSEHPRISRREIIVVFNLESDKFVFLRLPAGDWATQLNRFYLIPTETISQKVIDMRLPNTAYVTTLKDNTNDKNTIH